MVRIQLGGHRGSSIKGYMVVDDVDRDMNGVRWSVDRYGYAYRYSGGVILRNGKRAHARRVVAAREVLARKLGRPLLTHERCDHKNHNTTDNRRDNLRLTTQSGNGQNRAGAQVNSTSGHRGVSWHARERKYKAGVCKEGVRYHCGTYATLEEASAAASAKRRELGMLGL